ncbi:LOW QUALITY PROTEIN: cilia- and flagella-associated protein 337-like [Argopecten irradians]|uniref:LOW QUALITY PROTEIN: cilia- and flagella-associated protein 337-like n=1 Tax=Argopecten irradians TaxID=31199 RepID=UPI00371DC2B8
MANRIEAEGTLLGPSRQDRKPSYQRKRRQSLAVVNNPWGLTIERPSWGNESKFSPSEEILLLRTTFTRPKVYNMPPGKFDTTTIHGIKKKIRPSSAAAKLQSHPSFYSNIFDNSRPATATTSTRSPEAGQRPVTHAAAGRRQYRAPPEDERLKEIAKQPRRLTLGAVDGISELENIPRPTMGHGAISAQLKSKIEEQINLDTLEILKQAFVEADEDGSGELELDEFKSLLKERLHLKGTTTLRDSPFMVPVLHSKLDPSVLSDAQIDSLFMKIDWSSDGAITWDEFCTYMQLEYAEKEDSYLRSKDVAFHLPAKIINCRESILRITDTSDGTFVACSLDGNVSFLGTNMDIKKHKALINNEPGMKQKQKWITDFVIMNEFNKFLVGTGDREIQFYELSSLDPYCQVSGLDTVPLKLDYCSTGTDECLILYGDSLGCINILLVDSAGECLRTWKKAPKHDGIASVSLDSVIKIQKVQYLRWQVHGDWVQQLKYYHNIGQIISCSNNANTALVIGCTTGSTHVEAQLKETKDSEDRARRTNVAKPRLEADQSVFYVYKGVKCFDFCKNKNVIVTGGMDRIVRLWNPYVPGKPTALLRGHNAPIFYLFIAEEESRIFSISTDKCVKVWDIQDHNCLLTIRPKAHKIHGDLQACHYSNIAKSLAVATDQKLAALNLRQKMDQNINSRPVLHADITITHKEPVTCCKYNSSFNQVITCSEGSVIKLWDFETGAGIFEFGDAHGEAAITCMTFDSTGRRLLTGGRDGTIKIWNYNNGHCLRMLKKEAETDEVCDLTYVEMNRNRYVISVGWDRTINIYSDDANADSNIHLVQHPNLHWADDKKSGHKEDILAIAQSPPNLIATGSYDGEVIVWNMVSGHIFCHLHAPVPPNYEDESLDGDLSVNRLVFLKSRESRKTSASLIASGPRGHIHFWNVFQGGSMMAQFKGSKNSGGMITTMATDDANTMLFCGDSLGFILIYDVDGYCLNGKAKAPPTLIHSWRGHVDSVLSLEMVEKNKVILTASMDCTVRMWTFNGDYIGTYGQPEPWDLYDPSSFQHPMVPYDVLIDPMSLPTHPIFDQVTETPDLSKDETKTDEIQIRTPTPQVTHGGKNQFFVDDDTIAKQLKDLSGTLKDEHLTEEEMQKFRGKWLRHEKTKIKPTDRGGPSEYHMLKWSPLKDTPMPPPPKHRFNKDNPLDFTIS